MTFKELVQQDAKEIFLNFSEFGETHLVDGEEKVIIIDTNELVEREKRRDVSMAGVFKKHLLFYIQAEDLGGMPKIGGVMMLDRKSYVVTDAINEDGIYSISLEASKA